MYCVKCGVRLEEGRVRCPLCGTSVWCPGEQDEKKGLYPGAYPQKTRDGRLALTVFLTVLLALAALVSFQICRHVYGEVAWSGYAMLGIAVLYVVAVLPGWFDRPSALVLLPLDHAALAGLLLYISVRTDGGWFLSFAFPLVGISCIMTCAMVALLRYCKKGRLFIIGGSVAAAGGFAILIEFFQTITFGTKMFTWSLYVASACGFFGLFLLIAAIIKPLREYLNRRFFL